ncbi:TetR/AcrR family transcriptional regulator [Halomonas sp. I5-271120]|uniref:acrylate utilization transcriptional regulator AcuR n=1 Tax=Halomonas sp. I5-271120 TaxID=3061632 RepID=UPI0027151B33|nr:TetR/AcrR family transcriptional regulator [Halomonas sp. I5-271120]
MTDITTIRRRGRPPRVPRGNPNTREALIRSGLEVLTEQGFRAAGIDGILKRVGVPKGSFYHYFPSKEVFGRAVLEQYATFFARKLDRHLRDESLPPLSRINAFVEDAKKGMARHGFRRGCLVGNLGQEVGLLPDSYRAALEQVLGDWQQRLAECLDEARKIGALAPDADCDALADYFWIGWEGAVMRAKLKESPDPLDTFVTAYMAGLPRRRD